MVEVVEVVEGRTYEVVGVGAVRVLAVDADPTALVWAVGLAQPDRSLWLARSQFDG